MKRCFILTGIIVIFFVSIFLEAVSPAPASNGDFHPGVFKQRRDALMDQMKTGAAILFAAVESRYAVPFHQDNDFYYFTGLEEPNALILMMAESRETILFIPRLSEREEKMSGPNLLSNPKAAEIHQISKVLPMDMMAPFLSRLGARPSFDIYLRLSPRDTAAVSRFEDVLLHASESRNIFNDRLPLENLQTRKFMEKYPQHHYRDITPMIDDMRLFKGEAELGSLRKNGKISAHAHIAAMKATHPDAFEYEIGAAALYTIYKNGAQGPAYPPIVASGPNTCVLHYAKNNRKAQKGELILMDFGAQMDYLCIDISRTWPVSGKFTAEQKTVYTAVLEMQKAVIQFLKPGVTQDMVAQHVEKVLKEKGVNTYGETARYHHFIGMATHDVGPSDTPLKEGMVLTVEPGVYFKDKNLGVRIEDTVLITKDGCEVLTADVPKEIEDIEALMKK